MGLAVAMVESEEDGEGSKNGSGGDGSHGMKIYKNLFRYYISAIYYILNWIKKSRQLCALGSVGM